MAYENAQGKVVATQNGAGVSLSLAPAATADAGTATAVVGGSVAVNFVRCVARFTAEAGPAVNLPGDYTLTAADSASPAVAADVSKPFTVVGYHLVVREQPTTADADKTIPITVALLDGKIRVVTAESTAAVTLTYKMLSGGVDAVQTGTLVKTLSGGVAAFTAAAAPAFDRAGVFQFAATETGTAAVGTVASTQTVDAKPIRVRGDHLVFVPGPANASVDDPLKVSVARVDSKGRRVTGSDSVFKTFASLSLTAVSGGAGATLTNPSTELASGLATFTGLSVNRPGTYTLTAVRKDGQGQTEDDTLPVTSKPFKVTGLHVVAQLQPKADLLPYGAVPLRFALVDLTTDGAVVQHDGNGTLLTGVLSVSDNPGTFVLDASATAGDPAAVTPEAGKTRPFKFVPLHLAVQRAATTVVQYGAIPTQVALVDPNGRVDTSDSITKVAVTLNGPAGSLVNGAGHTFAAGVADLGTASGIGVDRPGTYTLTIGLSLARVGTSTPATALITTAPFQVTPVSVAITTQPADAAVNGTTPFAVDLIDAAGARVTTLATIQSAVLTRQPTGGTAPGVLLAVGVAFEPNGDSLQVGTVDAGDVPGTYTIVVTLQVFNGPPIGSPVVSTPFVVG